MLPAIFYAVLGHSEAAALNLYPLSASRLTSAVDMRYSKPSFATVPPTNFRP